MENFLIICLILISFIYTRKCQTENESTVSRLIPGLIHISTPYLRRTQGDYLIIINNN